MQFSYDMDEGWTLNGVHPHWEKEGRNKFVGYNGEQIITIHAIGMQGGTWTGVFVHEKVDCPVESEEFEADDESLETVVNEIAQRLT